MTHQRREELAALAGRIETIAKDPGLVAGLDDDTVRRRLRDAGTRLTHALESKNDSIHRIAYSVSMPDMSTRRIEQPNVSLTPSQCI